MGSVSPAELPPGFPSLAGSERAADGDPRDSSRWDGQSRGDRGLNTALCACPSPLSTRRALSASPCPARGAPGGRCFVPAQRHRAPPGSRPRRAAAGVGGTAGEVTWYRSDLLSPPQGLSEGISGWGLLAHGVPCPSPLPFQTEAVSPALLSTLSPFLFQRHLGPLNADGYTPEPVGERLGRQDLGMPQEPWGPPDTSRSLSAPRACYKASFLQRHPGASPSFQGPEMRILQNHLPTLSVNQVLPSSPSYPVN